MDQTEAMYQMGKGSVSCGFTNPDCDMSAKKRHWQYTQAQKTIGSLCTASAKGCMQGIKLGSIYRTNSIYQQDLAGQVSNFKCKIKNVLYYLHINSFVLNHTQQLCQLRKHSL